MIDGALSWPGRVWERVKAARRPGSPASGRRGLGLSAKLLLLTAVFVMLAEVLIFVPSIANFRINWLSDRLTAARLAGLASQAARDGTIPDQLRDELLRTAQVRAVAWLANNERRMVLWPDQATNFQAVYDFRA